MSARVVSARNGLILEHDEANGSLAALVRKLVSEIQDRSSSLNGHGGRASEDVIMDIEVDGVRCVLTKAHPHGTPHVVLSPRELEIARMIARGYPNKTIAAALEISSWTVCTHLRRSFSKLGVTSRAAMIARMAQSGLLEDRGHRAVV
jgi:DNA-binding CsgD family transcriptional regulator